MADAGVPTLSQLAAAFPATEIARAGEAELAGEITDDNWLKRFWRGLGHSISEVITVRPTGPDVEGDDTLARLARAEAKLGEGDLGRRGRRSEARSPASRRKPPPSGWPRPRRASPSKRRPRSWRTSRPASWRRAPSPRPAEAAPDRRRGGGELT